MAAITSGEAALTWIRKSSRTEREASSKDVHRERDVRDSSPPRQAMFAPATLAIPSTASHRGILAGERLAEHLLAGLLDGEALQAGRVRPHEQTVVLQDRGASRLQNSESKSFLPRLPHASRSLLPAFSGPREQIDNVPCDRPLLGGPWRPDEADPGRPVESASNCCACVRSLLRRARARSTVSSLPASRILSPRDQLTVATGDTKAATRRNATIGVQAMPGRRPIGKLGRSRHWV